jgi:hypothetical protein
MCRAGSSSRRPPKAPSGRRPTKYRFVRKKKKNKKLNKTFITFFTKE